MTSENKWCHWCFWSSYNRWTHQSSFHIRNLRNKRRQWRLGNLSDGIRRLVNIWQVKNYLSWHMDVKLEMSNYSWTLLASHHRQSHRKRGNVIDVHRFLVTSWHHINYCNARWYYHVTYSWIQLTAHHCSGVIDVQGCLVTSWRIVSDVLTQSYLIDDVELKLNTASRTS